MVSIPIYRFTYIVHVNAPRPTVPCSHRKAMTRRIEIHVCLLLGWKEQTFINILQLKKNPSFKLS